MALSLTSGNLVWAAVKNSLSANNTPDSLGTDPSCQAAFDGLKRFLAQQKRNPQLQFIAFTAEQATTNGGTDLVGAACTIYGLYAKGRRTTGTTASFLAIHAAADNSATTTTLITKRFKVKDQQFCYVDGLGLACETGCTISAATAVGGSTESSAADAFDGFIIVGA